jgi:hypothetical protein
MMMKMTTTCSDHSSAGDAHETETFTSGSQSFAQHWITYEEHVSN